MPEMNPPEAIQKATSTLYPIAFVPTWKAIQYSMNGNSTELQLVFPPIEHRIGREGLVHGIYFRLSWFQSSLILIYFRYGGRDRRGVASFRYRICAEITDLLREQKLCLV